MVGGYAMNDFIDQLKEAMRSRGLMPPANIISDGLIHRCDVEGKGGKNDGSYLLHNDGIPAGGFENHKDCKGWENWCANIGRRLSPEEENFHKQRIERMRVERENAMVQKHQEAREVANLIWAMASPCVKHGYLTKKRVKAHATKVIDAELVRKEAPNLSPELKGSLLVIPMRDSAGVLHSLQFITEDGTKRPLTGGRKQGCYFSIGKLSKVLCITEGFATGASVYEATGYAVAVAFDAGNLLAVAKTLKEKTCQK